MRTGTSFIAAVLSCLFLTSSTCHGATIYACKRKVGGTIRIVGAKTRCLSSETKMSWPGSADFTALNKQVAGLQTQVAGLQTQVAALQTLLQHFSRNGNDISISGANLWIKDGSGDTGGAVNGLGNLIVGYNEARAGGNVRTGSHNLVVGNRQNYSSFGGMVAGDFNTIAGPYATVSGGQNNTASGQYSSVSGGNVNKAWNFWSSVSGGQNNTASGQYSSVGGGRYNIAGGAWSSVGGGKSNFAYGLTSSLSGGYENRAEGSYSSVSGGMHAYAVGPYDWRAGHLFQDY